MCLSICSPESKVEAVPVQRGLVSKMNMCKALGFPRCFVCMQPHEGHVTSRKDFFQLSRECLEGDIPNISHMIPRSLQLTT